MGFGGNGGDPGVVPYDFETLATFIKTNCESCHVGMTGDSHNPDYRNDTDQLYTTLTTYTVERCEGKTLVEPGQPENSAFVLVIEGGHCEDIPVMPFGRDEFSTIPDEIPAIAAWIAAGAPKE